VRETEEEAGLRIAQDDLHLFAMIAEKAYQGDTHWLMFLFRCKTPIPSLPAWISVREKFGFFSAKRSGRCRSRNDKAALWPIFDRLSADRFVSLRADCTVSPIKITVEQITPGI